MNNKTVNIMEVCPRDGWQNLPEVIPTDRKIYYIEKMIESGVGRMQICSFVSPEAIPQMADAAEVSAYFIKKYPRLEFDALVPNLKGAKAAADIGFQGVSYVISVSESHNRANIRRTHEQSWAELDKIITDYPQLEITLALATAFGCPFEGRVSFERVMGFVESGLSRGITRFELADTIGVGNPLQVERIFSELRNRYPRCTFLAHMHDTRNNGVLNSWIAAESGADIIHTALGGLGGCPFAPGASGNTSTEDLVYLLEKSGIGTGIRFEPLLNAAKEMGREINGTYSGHHIHIVSDSYEKALKAERR